MEVSEKNGVNSEDLLLINRRLLLAILRKEKITTRANLAKMTGLKRATITNIINEFIEYGLVKEVGFIEGEKGRRSIGITLEGTEYKIIAIRIARQYFETAVFDISGKMYVKTETAISFIDGADDVLNKLKKSISNLLKKYSGIISIGIALPGPYIKYEDRIVQISDFAGWENINIVSEIQKSVGIKVFADHDGNASVLAEWWLGNHKENCDVLINIISGQGNGAGIIANGKIFAGANGLAGEIGNTSIAYDGLKCECGNRGCLDLYSSSIVLLREISNNLKKYPNSILNTLEINKKNVSLAVSQGDELAIYEVKRMATFLSYAIVNVINSFDPSLIVIGDEMAEIGGEVFLETIKSEVKRRVLPDIYKNIKIKLSNLEYPILKGAMTIAMENIFEEVKLIKG